MDGNKISYVHSFRWSKDGLYDHGVQQGTVTISDKSKSLAEQIWEEKNKIGEENETWRHVQLAEPVEIRRLNAF